MASGYSKNPKLMERSSNPRGKREMASGHSKIPKLIRKGSNPRTQRTQELRQRFEAPANRPAESQRGESSQGSKKQRPNNGSRYRDQAPEAGQQDPGPTSQVQAMRQKFETPSKKPAESQKEESRPGSHRQRFSGERGQGSRGPVQANRPAESHRGESSQGYQKHGPNNRYHDQASVGGQQGPGPTSQVQAMRQKFETPSKKPAESQKEESRPGSHRQRLSGERGQGSRGPVQAMRQKYEALSDKSARSQKDEPRHGSPKQRAGDRSRSGQESGAGIQDLAPSGPGQGHRQKYEAPTERDKSGGSSKEASRQDSGRTSHFPWSQPVSRPSNRRDNNESPQMKGFFDDVDLGSPRAYRFSTEPPQEDVSFEFGEIDEFMPIDIDSPPPFGFPPSHSFSPSAFADFDPATLEEIRYNLDHPPEIQDEDFKGNVSIEMSEPPPNLEITQGVVRRERPSDRSHSSQKQYTSPPRDELEGQESGRSRQESGKKHVTYDDSLNGRPGSSHASGQEEHDRKPSFTKAYASSPQKGRSGGATSGIRDLPRSTQGSFSGLWSSMPQPGTSGGSTGGATGGIRDQPRSNQDYEAFYHNNKEKVKNYDSLNHEIRDILSQNIPSINAEEGVSSDALASVMRDFIEDLHEDLRKLILELDNLRGQIGGQDLQEDSYMSSPRRSRHSSGYQASSPPSPDSSQGGPPRPQLRRRRMGANDYDPQSTASPEHPQERPNFPANVPQYSPTHMHDPQSTPSSSGPSSRPPSGGPPSQRSTRSPSHRGHDETDELMSTNKLEPGNEGLDRQGAGHYHTDIEEFIATRRLEPSANTVNARMEDMQDFLREINLQNRQSSSAPYSTTDDSHDSQAGHSEGRQSSSAPYSSADDSHDSQAGHSEPSMADDHSAIDEPLDNIPPRARSPGMLGRLWNASEMDLQLQGFNAEPPQGSSGRSPDSFQEQPGSSASPDWEAPDVGNENRVCSPGMFGRRWNPQDLNEQLERINAPPQQESRGETEGPVQGLNGRWEDGSPSFSGSEQSHRRSPHQNSRPHSSQMQSPRAQPERPIQDFNRRWNLTDQFARMQAENEPPTDQNRNSPYQEEYDSGSEEEWDEGCY